MRRIIFLSTFTFFLPIFLSTDLSAQRGAFKVVTTQIPVHYSGGIAVGDSVIVFGTGSITGVDYIRDGDQKPRGIPDAGRFRSSGFAVAGDLIVLIDNSEFSYHVFDPATGKMTDIPGLKNRGATPLRSSGKYVLAVTHDRWTNKEAVAIIDLSGSEPVVNVHPLWKGASRIGQAAFDATAGWLAVTDGYEKVAAILFKSGDTEPILHDITDTNGASTEPMAVGGDDLYYFDGKSGVHSVYRLNLRTGAKTKLAVNPATFLVAAGGGTVAYFARRDARDMNGTEARLVMLKKGGAPAVAVPADKFIDGATKNNGMMGFGNRIAVTPDGRYVFISGSDSIGATEILQYADGAGVKLVSGSTSATRPKPLPGSDVVASTSLVAFKTGAGQNTSLAYIKLR
jgi:hypothetical protein